MTLVTNKERVLRSALIRSGNPPQGDFLQKNDGIYGDAQFFYNSEFQAVLSELPWSFATLERSIRFENKVDDSVYSYEFSMPQDVLFLWDIYAGNQRNRDLDYYESNPYSYISLPLLGTPSFISDFAKVVNGRLRSIHSDLTLFYTHSNEILDRSFSEPFIKVLSSAVTIALREGKNTSVEHLHYFEQKGEKARARGLRAGSVENQGPSRVEPTNLVKRLRSLRI